MYFLKKRVAICTQKFPISAIQNHLQTKFNFHIFIHQSQFISAISIWDTLYVLCFSITKLLLNHWLVIYWKFLTSYSFWNEFVQILSLQGLGWLINLCDELVHKNCKKSHAYGALKNIIWVFKGTWVSQKKKWIVHTKKLCL